MATQRAKRLSYIEETPKHYGKLKSIVKEGVKTSIAKSRDQGLYITYKRGNEIIREYPDGRIEVIDHLFFHPRKVKIGTKCTLR